MELLTPNTDKIYILGLRLEPNKRGTLVGISQVIDENIYNQMKDNLTTTKKNGKLEVGIAGKNGIQFRLAFNSLESLNSGIKNILLLGKDVVDNGLSLDASVKPKPRPDLNSSYETLAVFWEQELEHPRNLQFLTVNELTNKALQQPSIARLVQTTKFELREDPFTEE